MRVLGFEKIPLRAEGSGRLVKAGAVIQKRVQGVIWGCGSGRIRSDVHRRC